MNKLAEVLEFQPRCILSISPPRRVVHLHRGVLLDQQHLVYLNGTLLFRVSKNQVTQKFPFISSYRAFRVPSSVDVASLVKCQLVVASFGADGKHVDVTGLQLPGVLDDMFAYTGPLGAVFSKDSVSLHLWAPTTQDVSVWFLDGPPALL
ncbi:pullulanase 1, chloroplastic-like isoform X1 [Aegilops tauschii subsp. strangulata]|uniref:pullulanase 1, chloroplastic-like isoform X1 n=1 Tax=Aegilops tauschii subsp. strangulata TaxID=200361 RepID=UPI003CC885E3